MAQPLPLTVHAAEIQPGRVLRYTFQQGSRLLKHGAFLSLLKEDATFRATLNSIVSTCPFEALRFEMPAFSRQTVEKDFEFVLVNSPGLALRADRSAFADHFDFSPVSAFTNLGGDATLIVPSPIDEKTDYRHLASFCRTTISEQADALWQRVATETLNALSDRPAWVSTAGAGVSWLHVRIDQRPKYYAYPPYKALS